MKETEDKHNPKLAILFFVEMWERFGFYLMLGIFVLCLKDAATGYGMTKQMAGDIYGTFIALVYLTPVIGGLIAESYIGYRISVLIGASLMAIGYFTMGLMGYASLYIGLILIVFGNGFFKPVITSMVGKMYHGSKKHDAAFNIFYFGINLGAFFSPLVASVLRNKYGWGIAFTGAGVGMVIGLLIFATAFRALKPFEAEKFSGTKKAIKHTSDEKLDEQTGTAVGFKQLGIQALLPGLALGILGYFVGGTNGAFFGLILPVIIFYVTLFAKARGHERKRIGALLAMTGCMIFFWMAFHQNGLILNVWADENTIRGPIKTGTSVLTAIDMGEQVYACDSCTIQKPGKDGELKSVEGRRMNNDGISYTSFEKIETGEIRQGQVYCLTASKEEKPCAFYYDNAQASIERPQKGNKAFLISAEIFQAINPLFIMALTPVILFVWSFHSKVRRKNKGKEITTPYKIAIGLLVACVSILVMVFAFLASEEKQIKVSSLWLVNTYFLITIAELCLSPMGLSLVRRIAPKSVVAIMIALFFLSVAIGNKLCGILGGLWETISPLWILYGITGCLLLSAIAFFAMAPWLNVIIEISNKDKD